MKHFKLKTKPFFLELIKKGIQTHEYRLADSSFNISIGDILILVLNQNKNDFVKVRVEKILHYNNWKEALETYWEKEFLDVFENFSDLIKECRCFYKDSEVELLGINVFEIKKIEKNFIEAKYLLDTNAIIEREGYNNPSPVISHLFCLIDKLKGIKMIHPKTKEELEKHENSQIRNILVNKLFAYHVLTPSENSSSDFVDVCEKKIFSQNENSKIDNEILKQVYNVLLIF